MRGFHGGRITTWRLGRVALALAVWVGFAAAAAAQQEPTFPTLPPDVPAGQGRTQPCLDQVDGEAFCGRFRVWEDREAQNGRTVDVAFVVLKALQDRGNTDAFVPFSGGPGAPTTRGAFFFARGLSDLRQDRDVVLVDHRGTGNSARSSATTPSPAASPPGSRRSSRSITWTPAATCCPAAPICRSTRPPPPWTTWRTSPPGSAIRSSTSAGGRTAPARPRCSRDATRTGCAS